MSVSQHLEAQLPILLDLLLKSVLVTGLAALSTAALHRVSAANRHAILFAAFVALLLLPFTKLAPPRFSYTLRPDARPATAAVDPPAVAAAPASQAISDVSSAAVELEPPREAQLGVSRAAVGVAVWIAGVALLLVRRAAAGFRLRRLDAASRPVDDRRILAIARRLESECGVAAELRESEECRVPLVFGVRRPTVMLPIAATHWSDERLTAALRHEFGHVGRRDCLTRRIVDLACAVYWINPLVWFAARSLRLLQEQACDDQVLNAGARPDDYAAQLVEAVRALQGDRLTTTHAPAMAQPSTLETRVLAVLDAGRDRRPRDASTTVFVCLSAAVALGACLSAQLRGADHDKAAAAVERGLAFLASRQEQDGSVAAGDFRGRVGATSLAGLAWLGDERRRLQAERAATYVLSCQRDDGYITGPAPQGGSMYDHGFATLFLAEYFQATSSPDVKIGLVKAVAVIVKSQGAKGGWRYAPTPADGDTSISACQLLALAAAKNAGVEVPDAAFSAGVGFLKSCQNPDGGFGYTAPASSAFPRSAAALCASLVTAKWSDPRSLPDAAKGADYVLAFLPKAGAAPKSTHFFIHGHYYAGPALRLRNADDWNRWNAAIREHLLSTQNQDGAWFDEQSVEVATSEACLILQTRNTAAAKDAGRPAP